MNSKVSRLITIEVLTAARDSACAWLCGATWRVRPFRSEAWDSEVSGATRPGNSHDGLPRTHGFTLVEIMIVLSIIAIVLATGVPSILSSLKKEGLRKAQSDLVEACSHARAQAILSGVPMELVIRAEGNQVSVEPLKTDTGIKNESEFTNPEGSNPLKQGPKNFSARLDEDIGIRLLYVNFKDHMEYPEARVRFFPNGTCDEFTIMFFSPTGERKLALDVVTGLADVEVIR